MTEDVKFTLNTATSGEARTILDEINGKLCAFLLSADKQCQVKIYLRDAPDIVLFNQVDFNGTHYIPIRIHPRNNKNEIFNFVADHYYLNDSIVVELKGGQSTNLKGVVRYV